MDFNDTKQEAEFRTEACAWLALNAPRLRDSTCSDLQWAKKWEKKKFEGGWSCIHWPKQYGGKNSTTVEQIIFSQEESKYAVLQNYPCFNFGQGMVGPVLMAYGTEEQKRRYLPRIASGDEVWCQLFSEPCSGSDLAALRTKAVKEKDHWIINGQKIWSSFAHYSDLGLMIVRTDASVPKHQGLSCFLVEMDAPGIALQSIRDITGSAEFNEEFFTDLHIADTQRLGDIGAGWKITLTTLMNERASLRGRKRAEDVDALLALAGEVDIDGEAAINNAAVRDKIADWWCNSSGLYYNGLRSLTAQSKGDDPGPEESIAKMIKQPMVQDIYAFCLELMEGHGAITSPNYALQKGIFQAEFMASPGMRIAGGTDEILANIIADRVLHLPADTRVDKWLPFNDIPSN
jgi:acyl-CoA dehydrogenase